MSKTLNHTIPNLNIITQPTYFITGIDTDIGKTYATGYLAKQLALLGKSVITQKLIQTGNQNHAEDILTHRQIMNAPLNDDDHAKLTMPIILPYPASPHLASRLSHQPIDITHLQQCTKQLTQRYDVVLIEGAGGLFVPITDTPPFFIIDYIKKQQYPTILVTSGRLGSINHTLLSLNALQQYQIEITALLYNPIHDHQDPIIGQDSQVFLQNYIKQHLPNCQWWSVPIIN